MKNTACFLVALLLICACASQPPKRTTATQPDTSQPQTTPHNTLNALKEPRKSATATQHIKTYIASQDWPSALATLQQIALTERNTQWHSLLLWQASVIASQPHSTKDAINWYEQQPSLPANRSQTLAAHLRFAAIKADTDNIGTGIEYWLTLSTLNETSSYDISPTWHSLIATPSQIRNTLKANYNEHSPALGWLALTDAFHSRKDGYQRQLAELITWQSQWLDHPAAKQPPEAINTVFNYPIAPEKQAAALIPLSGKLAHVGRALQTGILAAHDYAPQFANIYFIDSHSVTSVDSLFTELHSLNIDVIIGPLDKSLAETIANHPARQQPIIALNRLNSNTHSPDVLQLSLMIEDEARFLAHYTAESFHHPLMIATPHPIAERTQVAFNTTWKTQLTDTESSDNNTLSIAQLSTQDKYSDEVAEALLLRESHTRLREIEDVFIKRMENNLRRREDIDSIILAATPNQARSIKPLLAYHFAGDLPVLATSSIFDGSASSTKNRDLDGIIFVDTPWAIHANDPIKQRVQNHISHGGTRSKNLHALAIDGYFLAAAEALSNISQHAFAFTGRSGEYLFNTGEQRRLPATAKISAGAAQPFTIQP